MIPHIQPMENLSQAEVFHKRKKFPIASASIGVVTKIKKLVLGTETEENLLVIGKKSKPVMMPE